MQTFLPLESFTSSARVLDRKRLGKQRVETLQLLKALTTPTYGWRNHPAAKMWLGHELRLIAYGVAMCDEWIRRGYKDTCRDKILNFADNHAFNNDRWDPAWLGNEQFHASHRSNLLRKDPDYYSQFGWTDDPEAPYIWPVQ